LPQSLPQTPQTLNIGSQSVSSRSTLAQKMIPSVQAGVNQMMRQNAPTNMNVMRSPSQPKPQQAFSTPKPTAASSPVIDARSRHALITWESQMIQQYPYVVTVSQIISNLPVEIQNLFFATELTNEWMSHPDAKKMITGTADFDFAVIFVFRIT